MKLLGTEISKELEDVEKKLNDMNYQLKNVQTQLVNLEKIFMYLNDKDWQTLTNCIENDINVNQWIMPIKELRKFLKYSQEESNE